MVRAWRIGWTVATLVVVQTIVIGLSVAPSVFALRWLVTAAGVRLFTRYTLLSLALAPAYVAFALLLMIISPLATRLLGWRSPEDAEMRIADLDWALLRWVRHGASIHLVRVLAGTLFRGTPLWTSHVRLGGATLGRRVYINSLSVSDYNLLECGDDVVIGGAVHLSGHTVESGIVKTARVRVGSRVTIGLGSIVEIGAEIGSDTKIGALSFVPKHAKLEGGHVYAGAPVNAIR